MIASIAIGAGCGGGSNSADASHTTIDAGTSTDAPITGATCGTAASTITSYPGTFTGSTAAGAGTLTVAMGVCTQEDNYDGAAGATQTVVLNDLTPGTTYVVNLVTTEDLLFYIATACDSAGPTATGCLVYEDQTTGNETGTFVAPTNGSVSVIVSSSVALASGAQGVYTLNVTAAECTQSSDCTDASKPICSAADTCVGCESDFDCISTSATPTCDTTTTNSCVAGVASTCTGADADEPDDYPAEATALAYPTANTPTVHTGSGVCNIPATESDWYKIVVPADNSALSILIDWTAAGADLDASLFDDQGNDIDDSKNAGPSEHFAFTFPTAGTYYLQVIEYSSADETNGPVTSAANTAYTVTLDVSNCTTSFDCTNAAKPVCDGGLCSAGPTACTGDDAADNGNGDDGPTDATNVVVAAGNTSTAINADACNINPLEADWYKTTVAAGEGLVITTSWESATDTFTTLVFDSTGTLFAGVEYVQPGVTTLTYLPAGTYFIEVVNTDATPITAAAPYTLTIHRTASQSCASASDCAASSGTQFYRGDCESSDHACHFIAASGAVADGGACDTGTDCSSATCSADLELFATNAQKSFCTPMAGCSADSDCATLGSGFTCYSDFGFCIPACTKDTDCGANPSITTVTSGQSWAYGTCDVPSGDCTAPVDPNAGG